MYILTKYLRQIIKQVVLGFFISLSLLSFVQAQENTAAENKLAYISDDLTIYMHAGPGTNYRILGTIIAGTEIQTTGKSDKGYSEIIDDKNRVTWVETKYIIAQPGLRYVVADLNEKLSKSSDYTAQLDGEINELKSNIERLTQEKKQLQDEYTLTQQQLEQTLTKVKTQDTDIQKQWFFNGAIVLAVGLLLGLILPKIFARRRSSMDSWS